MISLDLLIKIEHFQSLEPETRNVIAQRCFERDLPAGYTLIIEGMPAEYGYFLISGQVRALRISQDGRVQVLARFGPGDPLNVISLLSNQKLNRASIETVTQAKLLVIDQSTFEFLTANNPDFSLILLKIFANRMTKITDLAANLSLYTVRARLARFLMDLADTDQSVGGWTQDEIAAHIGTVRDVVGRLLREFETEGLIARKRQQVTLLDRQGLMNEAGQDI